MASPDTDVFVFLVCHFSCTGLCEIVFKTGRKSISNRFILIQKVVCMLNEDIQTFS